jgi:hypothetical protein
MSTSITSRGIALITAAAISLLAAFAMASQADAATLYACVKKEGGSMRLVSQRTKCNRKSERKVSWSTTGPAGHNGANGADGKNGTNGANGANGQNLTSQTPLAVGQSESGAFAVGAGQSEKGFVGEGITFAQPLPSPIALNHVVYNVAKATTVQCPGVGHAAPGFMCLYESEAKFLTFFVARDFNLDANAADPFGVSVFFEVKPGVEGFVAGVWTVTAG